MENLTNLANMTISEIAYLIKRDWKKMYFGAVPYVDAMTSLNSINDNYIMDSGRSIVSYFLANASTWKGEVAREVKKHLNKLLKTK